MDAFAEKQKIIDRAPFCNLKIDDTSILDTVEGRVTCGKCYKSRKFFCYTCCTPVIDEKYIPRVKLPVKIDIIKHPREIDGKSTAVHAVILAPEDVTIYTYPDFPTISETEKTVLIFPSKTASSVDALFARGASKEQTSSANTRRELPITRAIFIDSTWQQTKSIYKEQWLRELPCVILKSRISQFWRHQKKSPRWYLATIEAIHQFLLELHTSAFEAHESAGLRVEKPISELPGLCREYDGQYDNLLFFFKYMYEKIHLIYDHEKLWAYKRPLF